MLLSDHCLCDDNECCTIQFERIYVVSVTIKLALSRNLVPNSQTSNSGRGKKKKPKLGKAGGRREEEGRVEEKNTCDCEGIRLMISQSGVYDWVQAGESEQLISSQLSSKSSLHVNTSMQIQPTVAQIMQKPHNPLLFDRA